MLSIYKHFVYQSLFQPPDLSSLVLPPPHPSFGALLLSFLNLCLPPISSQTHPQPSPWRSPLSPSRIMTWWQHWNEAATERESAALPHCGRFLKTLIANEHEFKQGKQLGFFHTTTQYFIFSLWFPTIQPREGEREGRHRLVPFRCGFSV